VGTHYPVFLEDDKVLQCKSPELTEEEHLEAYTEEGGTKGELGITAAGTSTTE
jgi:hypothetical protein